jgi:hypothetical protein
MARPGECHGWRIRALRRRDATRECDRLRQIARPCVMTRMPTAPFAALAVLAALTASAGERNASG